MPNARDNIVQVPSGWCVIQHFIRSHQRYVSMLSVTPKTHFLLYFVSSTMSAHNRV
jgi:hypothetical protein